MWRSYDKNRRSFSEGFPSQVFRIFLYAYRIIDPLYTHYITITSPLEDFNPIVLPFIEDKAISNPWYQHFFKVPAFFFKFSQRDRGSQPRNLTIRRIAGVLRPLSSSDWATDLRSTAFLANDFNGDFMGIFILNIRKNRKIIELK